MYLYRKTRNVNVIVVKEQIEKDLLRIWSVVQKTFPGIPKEYALKMWEDYSFYNGKSFLELPEKDDTIEFELKAFGSYDRYQNIKEIEWKIELVDTMLDEAGFVCSLSDVDKIIPGKTKIVNPKDSLGIIKIGKNLRLMLYCEK